MANFNIMDILNVPFGYIIKFCYMLIPNYAIALLLFAIIIKALMLPLGIKQQKNMIKQASLRPKEMAIRKKYSGRDDKATQQKMQEEIMEFYKKESYNPVGSCFPMLLQFPVIISLFNVINNPLKYICRLTTENVTAIVEKLKELDLVATDFVLSSEIKIIPLIRENFSSLGESVGNLTLKDIPNFNMFGSFFDLSNTPSFTVEDKTLLWLLIIPVVTFFASFFSMKLTRKFTYQPPTDTSGNSGNAMSLKIMDWTMPLFSVWITFTVPAIIGIYWIYQNVLGFVQQYILAKIFPTPVFTDEDYKKAEKEITGTVRREKKKEKTRSLHHIDDDEEIPQKNEKSNAKEITGKIDAPAGGAITPATLKEDKNGSVPMQKMNENDKNGEKPKPKSLHRDD